MKLMSERKSFVDEKSNETVNYNQVYLVLDNGQTIAIKPVYKNDKRLLVGLCTTV